MNLYVLCILNVVLLCDNLQAIFGVYVGHGGVKAAEFAAKNLDKNIVEEVVGKRHELEIAEAVET